MANETTTQIYAESPEIEAYKKNLLAAATHLQAPELPAYQVAGLTPQQYAAMYAGEKGIGAYAPYLQTGTQNVGLGSQLVGQAANILQGADTRGQFGAAQSALNQAFLPIAQMGQAQTGLANAVTQYNNAGIPITKMGEAQTGLANAQEELAKSGQPISQMGQQQGILDAQKRLANAGIPINAMGYSQQNIENARGTLNQGIGSLYGAAQGYNPMMTQAFMNPYQQDVVDASMREIERQGSLARQQEGARAVAAGAFGGSRQSVARAALDRDLMQQKANTVASLMNQGYSQAQASGMAAFEQQQQRQLAQAQGLQSAAGMGSQLAGQQANIYGQQSQLEQQLAQNMGNLAGQQANIYGQQAQLRQQMAQNMGSLAGQQANIYGQQSQLGQQVGQGLANVAGQQANIYGQQSQLGQQLGQGIGALAGQQFGIGQGISQGLAGYGNQLAGMGAQQAQLGQAAQGMAQNDINFLYNLGGQQQQQQQRELDALRATQMQNAQQPYQQLGFISDIYRGAPTSQMALTQQNSATPSAFQQIAGLTTGLVTGAGAAKSAGIL